tara:strand:+ start:1165 stop:1746 length:582 start_codon:yes stop_codon:yes gene_type:complete
VPAWKSYEQGTEVPRDYGLYTYVLGGRGEKSQQRLIEFDSVIRKIANPAETLTRDGISPQQINLFLLPAADGQTSCSFGRSLLIQFGITYGRDFDGIGPYLLTIKEPLRSGRPQTDILVADLSTFNTAAFPDIAQRYAAHFSSSSIKGDQYFASLASRTVDLLSDLTDFFQAFNSLGVGRAYADELTTPAKGC